MGVLNDRVALIAGAGRGIGTDLAEGDPALWTNEAAAEAMERPLPDQISLRPPAAILTRS